MYAVQERTEVNGSWGNWAWVDETPCPQNRKKTLQDLQRLVNLGLTATMQPCAEVTRVELRIARVPFVATYRVEVEFNHDLGTGFCVLIHRNYTNSILVSVGKGATLIEAWKDARRHLIHVRKNRPFPR
jgi:hypothetical protein